MYTTWIFLIVLGLVVGVQTIIYRLTLGAPAPSDFNDPASTYTIERTTTEKLFTDGYYRTIAIMQKKANLEKNPKGGNKLK